MPKETFAAGGSGHDQSSVDTDELRAVAERGRAALKEFGELLESVSQAVAASEAYWTGDAANLFRESLTTGLADYMRCLEDVADYPHELVSYADEYDGVITKAEAIAASLGDVTWTEPE